MRRPTSWLQTIGLYLIAGGVLMIVLLGVVVLVVIRISLRRRKGAVGTEPDYY